MISTHGHNHAQSDKTNDDVEFLQSYRVFTVDRLLEIGRAVILAVLSLDYSWSQTNTSCPDILLQAGVLLAYSVLPCHNMALLNAS